MPYYSVHHHKAPKLSVEQQQLKQALINTGEEWTTQWQTILTRDPYYFAAYTKLRAVPMNGQTLSRKVQELIMVAIDSSCTRLWQHGVNAHIGAALKAGASKQEVMEVLELTSVLGLHVVNVGIPLLQEVMEEKGQGQSLRNNGSLSEPQQKLQSSLQQRKDGDGGFWASTADALFALNPAFLEAGTEFTSVPFQREKEYLDPVTKELIYIAVDSSTAFFRQQALKTHIRNALDRGATPQQISAVFEIAALQGVHSVMAGAEALGDD